MLGAFVEELSIGVEYAFASPQARECYCSHRNCVGGVLASCDVQM